MNEKTEQLTTVPFSEVRIDQKLNCRGDINLGELTELTEDIQTNGLLQPVLMRYRHDDEVDKFDEPYVLVAGFSRSLACRDILKMPEIKTVIRDLTKTQAIIINASENLKRRDLNIMQEAEPIRRLMRMGMTGEEIQEALGKTRGWVQPRAFLLKLPEEVQRIAAGGFFTVEQIRDLYTLKDPADQIAAARKIKEKKQAGGHGKIVILNESSETKRNKAKIAHTRNKQEIENMLEFLVSIGFPVGIHTRLLAWAAGNVNDLDVQAAIQTHMLECGITSFYPNLNGIPNMTEQKRAI